MDSTCPPIIWRLESARDTFKCLGKVVQANVGSLSADQLITVLNGALANGQLRGSFQLPHVLSAVQRTDHAKREDIGALIAQVRAAI